MAYVTAEARQELLDAIAEATDEIAVALAALGEAFEQLDEQNADTLEEQLFRPVQHAYGRAKRTHSEFATRHGLPTRAFAPANQPAPHGAKAALEDAVEAVVEADDRISTLQDSMKPIEVGDPELRAGLSEVRQLLGDVESRARAFERRLGR
jgi:hypothetical protein